MYCGKSPARDPQLLSEDFSLHNLKQPRHVGHIDIDATPLFFAHDFTNVVASTCRELAVPLASDRISLQFLVPVNQEVKHQYVCDVRGGATSWTATSAAKWQLSQRFHGWRHSVIVINTVCSSRQQR